MRVKVFASDFEGNNLDKKKSHIFPFTKNLFTVESIYWT